MVRKEKNQFPDFKEQVRLLNGSWDPVSSPMFIPHRLHFCNEPQTVCHPVRESMFLHHIAAPMGNHSDGNHSRTNMGKERISMQMPLSSINS